MIEAGIDVRRRTIEENCRKHRHSWMFTVGITSVSSNNSPRVRGQKELIVSYVGMTADSQFLMNEVKNMVVDSDWVKHVF